MVVLVVMMVLMIFASEKVLSMKCFSMVGGTYLCLSRLAHDGGALPVTRVSNRYAEVQGTHPVG